MSRARAIGKNIIFIAVSRIVSVIVSFALLPFIMGYVGKEVYGVYLIVTAITGYFGIFDFGVMSALTKYVSEFNGKGDREGINKIASASLSFYILIGAFISLLLFASSLYFARFFNIEPANSRVVKQLFIVAAVSAIFAWPLNTFRGVIQGLNMWKIDSLANISNQALIALSTYLLLVSGYGIVALFISVQAITIFISILLYLTARRKAGLKLSFPYTDGAVFKFIFSFSFFMFLSSLMTIILFQLHNIIIGYFISLSAVSLYAVAYNIQNYFRVVNATIGAPSWIALSEMEGAHDFERQKLFLFKGTRYMSAFFLPAVLIMFFFTEPFIHYWMGPSFSDSIVSAKIIILFWLFNGTSELATGMLSAKGIVRRPLLIHFLTASTNILISLFFIKSLGITAVAMGLSLSMIFVGFPLYLRLSLKSLHIGIKEYFDKSIKGNLVFYLFVAVLSFITIVTLYPKSLLATLFEMGFLYAFSLAFYYLKFLNPKEKKEVLQLAGVSIV